MQKILFLLVALTCTNVLLAQKVVNVDDNGAPVTLQVASRNVLVNNKYVRVVEGTPFFKDEYLPSNFVQGASKLPVMLKLNLATNEIHFKDEKGQEMVATPGAKLIMLTDKTNGEKFTFVHSSSLNIADKITEGWYLQLATGKVGLYKFYQKKLSETLPYGQATTEQKIQTIPMLMVLKDGAITRVKRLKELQVLLADKSKEVTEFIKANFLNQDAEFDFYAVVTMYNDLFKPSPSQ